MGYVRTGMGDRFSVLLMSLMALQLMLVDRNPFQPCVISRPLFVNFGHDLLDLYYIQGTLIINANFLLNGNSIFNI